MCSRFELNARPCDLARRFSLADVPQIANRTEFRPTDQALVVVAGGISRMSAWGFAVDWSKSPLINARAETLGAKRTFAPFLEHRCLVPASAYFEWRKDGGQRLRNRISLAAEETFAMASLTDGERFTIITCPPAAAIAHIHNRMPVILGADGESAWLDPSRTFAAVAVHLTAPEKALQAIEETPPPAAQGELFA